MSATIWETVSSQLQPFYIFGQVAVEFTAAAVTAVTVNKLIHLFTGIKGMGLVTSAAVTLGAARAILEGKENFSKFLEDSQAKMIGLAVSLATTCAIGVIPEKLGVATALFCAGFLVGFISGLGTKSSLNAADWNEEIASMSVLLGGFAVTFAKMKEK